MTDVGDVAGVRVVHVADRRRQVLVVREVALGHEAALENPPPESQPAELAALAAFASSEGRDHWAARAFAQALSRSPTLRLDPETVATAVVVTTVRASEEADLAAGERQAFRTRALAWIDTLVTPWGVEDAPRFTVGSRAWFLAYLESHPDLAPLREPVDPTERARCSAVWRKTKAVRATLEGRLDAEVR